MQLSIDIKLPAVHVQTGLKAMQEAIFTVPNKIIVPSNHLHRGIRILKPPTYCVKLKSKLDNMLCLGGE